MLDIAKNARIFRVHDVVYSLIYRYVEQQKSGAETTAFGKALKLAKLYPEQSLLLLELIRFNVLSNAPLKVAYPKVVPLVSYYSSNLFVEQEGDTSRK